MPNTLDISKKTYHLCIKIHITINHGLKMQIYNNSKKLVYGISDQVADVPR